MTLLVLVIMPLTEMSLLMSEGFKSLMTLVSTRLCGLVCRPKSLWTKGMWTPYHRFTDTAFLRVSHANGARGHLIQDTAS